MTSMIRRDNWLGFRSLWLVFRIRFYGQVLGLGVQCLVLGLSVEFALHPQHETSCDSEIETKKDFKNKFRKQLGSSPTTSLNSACKEETLECLKS